MRPKVGDMVRLKPVRVDVVLGDNVFRNGEVYYKINEIEEILSRPFAVGDKVNFAVSPGTAAMTILAIDDNVAWMKFDDGGHSTSLLSVLRHHP